jgi:hypothetical protein
MAKNNFDDFLLDPSFDDLDSVHLEAQRQLYKNGGLFKRKKKKKNKNKVSDEQAAQIDKVASTNPDGSQQVGVSTKRDTPSKSKEQVASEKSQLKSQKGSVGVLKKDTDKPAKTRPINTTAKGPTKRGTGKTYEDVWNYASKEYKARYGGDKNKAIADMKAWNKKNDAKKAKPKAKPKATKVGNKLVSATEKKKLLSRNMWDKIPSGGNKM